MKHIISNFSSSFHQADWIKSLKSAGQIPIGNLFLLLIGSFPKAFNYNFFPEYSFFFIYVLFFIVKEMKEGEVVETPLLDLAGWFRPLNATRFTFCRKGSMDLWKKLEETVQVTDPHQVLNITGAPGCGKSTVLWHYALWKTQQTKKWIVWVNLSEMQILSLQNGICYVGTVENFDFLKHDQFKPSMLFFDGLTNAIYKQISVSLINFIKNEERKLMLSSVQVDVKFPIAIYYFQMVGWSIEDYSKAFQNDSVAFQNAKILYFEKSPSNSDFEGNPYKMVVSCCFLIFFSIITEFRK